MQVGLKFNNLAYYCFCVNLKTYMFIEFFLYMKRLDKVTK